MKKSLRIQAGLIKKLLPLLAPGQQAAIVQELRNVQEEYETEKKEYATKQKRLAANYAQTLTNASHGT